MFSVAMEFQEHEFPDTSLAAILDQKPWTQCKMTTISHQQHLNYPTMLTADVEKIAELASTADGLYGMTRSCYGSGWFSPSNFQNRNFAIAAKKP